MKDKVSKKTDAVMRYIAGFIFLIYVGGGIYFDSIDTAAIVVMSSLGAVLIGEEKAAELFRRG